MAVVGKDRTSPPPQLPPPPTSPAFNTPPPLPPPPYFTTLHHRKEERRRDEETVSVTMAMQPVVVMLRWLRGHGGTGRWAVGGLFCFVEDSPMREDT